MMNEHEHECECELKFGKNAETKSIIGDFTDGYFPSELQARYPDGIPFKVFDLRAEEYQKGDGLAGFGGNGRVLGGAARPSKLLAGGSGASSNIHTARDTEGGAVPTVSAESFLNRLPKQGTNQKKKLKLVFLYSPYCMCSRILPRSPHVYAVIQR